MEYGLFLAKTMTWVVALGFLGALILGLKGRERQTRRGELEVTALHDEIRTNRHQLRAAIMTRAEGQAIQKKERKEERRREKKAQEYTGKRLFVLDFNGDMKASSVDNLREEVTAVLGQARPEDEVVVKLESSGGMVHSYGLAASQLDRIRRKNIALTVCIDKVAASGGYMMACVANKIIAAPFSLVGSIGVIAQLPNFHRLLQKHDIDFEQVTAGDYKRTLTVFGENTEQGRQKFRQDLEEIHSYFKDYVKSHRASVEIDRVATGEVWLGSRAQELGLVDELMTSDEYLTGQVEQDIHVYQLRYRKHKSLHERIGMAAENRVDSLATRWWSRLKGLHLLR